MGLLRTLFWIGLFVVATFAFTVIFEHGFSDFPGNSQKQWDIAMKYYHSKVDAAPAKKP